MKANKEITGPLDLNISGRMNLSSSWVHENIVNGSRRYVEDEQVSDFSYYGLGP